MCATCALKDTPQDRKGSLCPIENFFLPFFPFSKKYKEKRKTRTKTSKKYKQKKEKKKTMVKVTERRDGCYQGKHLDRNLWKRRVFPDELLLVKKSISGILYRSVGHILKLLFRQHRFYNHGVPSSILKASRQTAFHMPTVLKNIFEWSMCCLSLTGLLDALCFCVSCQLVVLHDSVGPTHQPFSRRLLFHPTMNVRLIGSHAPLVTVSRFFLSNLSLHLQLLFCSHGKADTWTPLHRLSPHHNVPDCSLVLGLSHPISQEGLSTPRVCTFYLPLTWHLLTPSVLPVKKRPGRLADEQRCRDPPLLSFNILAS